VTATAATTPIVTVLMLMIVVVTTAATAALMTTEELLDLLWGSIMLIQHFTEHEPRGEFVLIVGKGTVSDKKQNIIDPIHSSSDEEDRRKMKRSKKWNK